MFANLGNIVHVLTSQSLLTFKRNRSPTYPPALVEQAALAFWDAACPGLNLDYQYDLSETLPDDILPDDYLSNVVWVFSTKLQSGSDSFDKEYEEIDWEDIETRAGSIWFLAMSSLSDFESPSRLERFNDLVWASAAAGCNPAIEYAVLALHGTHKGMQLPMRGLLSLLALSQSHRASEILHARWPAHYKMVQAIIAERPSEFEQANPCDHSHFAFMLSTIAQLEYPKEPGFNMVNTELTLKQAMNLGLVRVIREALNGNFVPDDFNESVAGLLHSLSCLPDSEGAALASIAYEKGAKLCFLAMAEVSFVEDIEKTETGSYDARKLSPLSAAIRRGKSELALAILDLHVKHDGEPIVDFGQAFLFSCVCLQHNIADHLLRFYRSSPHLCHEGDAKSPFSESILAKSMLKLIRPEVDLEVKVRMLHGPGYDIAKEQTLRVLVENGANPAECYSSPPMSALMRALELDNVTIVKYFLQVLEDRGIDVLGHLKALRRTLREPDGFVVTLDALVCCINTNSIQSFQYLLQKYPLQSWKTTESYSVSTKLHEACIVRHGTPFIEILLGSGADCAARYHGNRTPLALALQMGPPESAYAFLSHRPAETLSQLRFRDPETGSSVFHQLLVTWSTLRDIEMIEKFKWIIKHDGTHRLGPSDIPFWFWVLDSRSGHQTDAEQRLDVALFTLLLDTDKLSSGLSNEKVKGGNILHFSIIFGHVHMVRLLLDKGIDYNVTMECEMTGYFLKGSGLAVDPKTDVISCLDLAWAGCSRLAMPTKILQRGYLEAQKWLDDKEEIRDLLMEQGAHQGFYLGLHRDAMNHQRESVDDNSSNSHWGSTIDIVSSWPRPLGDRSTVPFPSKEQSREILSSERGRHQWVDDIFVPMFMRESMNEKREIEECDVESRLNLHIIKTMGHMQRHNWRLPSDWYCLFITIDKAEHGSYRRALYVNRETGEYTFKKPRLYRGGHVARGDATEDDEPSIDEEPEDIYNATPVMRPQLTPDTPTLPDFTTLSLENSRASSDSEQAETKRASQVPSSSWTKDASSCQTATSRTEDPAPIATDTAEDFYAIQVPGDYPSTTFEDGSNVIHLAVLLGNLGVLSIVLEQDATAINKERHDGLTALHVAVENKNVDALAMLMAYGADPNRCFPNKGYRPIHHSALQDSADMANVLVRADTDVTNRIRDYCSPYVQLSGRGADFGATVEMNDSSSSVRSTTLEVVTADVNATTAEGHTPLHLCVTVGGSADILETLISAGADVNAMDPEGSVLRAAVALGCETGVEILLDAGARVNADEHLLHAAAACGSVSITRKLLDLGLDVNKRDSSKQTPLIAAIENRDQEMIDLLCERGASKEILQEFRFFTRPRNDGKTEAMVLHVDQGSGASNDGEIFGSDDACGRWEEWDPAQLLVFDLKKVSSDHE